MTTLQHTVGFAGTLASISLITVICTKSILVEHVYTKYIS